MESDAAIRIPNSSNLPPEYLSIWKELESEKLNRMKESNVGVELSRAVMPFVNHTFAKIVRSLPSDRNMDHDSDGKRLFDYGKVTEEVLVGRAPRDLEDLIYLREAEGVHAVVSLSEDWELRELGWPDGMVASAGMAWIQLPTPVLATPFLSPSQCRIHQIDSAGLFCSDNV